MIGLRVFPDTGALADAAADHVAACAEDALRERGRFLLVLAGGTTPSGVYRRLGSLQPARIDWGHVHLFWGDERCVPPDDPRSNYAMVVRSLLSAVSVPVGHVHRIRGEAAPDQAAAAYDRDLAQFFGVPAPSGLGHAPAFDMALLGIGEDGHTASLFPDSPALDATGWAVATRAPVSADVRDRVSLTLPALDASRECLILAAGEEKREIVERAMEQQRSQRGVETILPAARVRARRRTTWYLDAAAAADALDA